MVGTEKLYSKDALLKLAEERQKHGLIVSDFEILFCFEQARSVEEIVDNSGAMLETDFKKKRALNKESQNAFKRFADYAKEKRQELGIK